MRAEAALAALAVILPAFSTGQPGAERQGLGLVQVAEAALRANPDLLVSRQRLAAARGVLRSAGGPFDPVLSIELAGSDADQPLGTAQQSQLGLRINDTHSFGYSLGATSSLRTGASLEAELSASRVADSLTYLTPEHQATLDLTLRQPLLEGRGRQVATAEENAARQQVLAEEALVSAQARSTTLAAVSRYWEYVGAVRSSLATERAADDADRLLENTRALAAADAIPRQEVRQAEAKVATRAAELAAARQKVVAARHALGLAMGARAGEIHSLPLPADDFPAIPQEALPELDRLVGAALARRDDLRAARQELQAARLLEHRAANRMLPRLDLLLGAGYASLLDAPGRSAFLEVYSANRGSHVQTSLRLELPVNRSAEIGSLEQARSAEREAALGVESLERAVASAVDVAASAVEATRDRATSTRAAREAYEAAVDNEGQKYSAGLATLIDVLITGDQLVAARLAEIQAQVDLATAIARLRFETACLPDSEDTVTLAALTSFPRAGELEE